MITKNYRVFIRLSLFSCFLFCSCNEKLASPEEAYIQAIMFKKCVPIYPPLCSQKLEKNLTEDKESNAILYELWHQFDTYRLEKKRKCDDAQKAYEAKAKSGSSKDTQIKSLVKVQGPCLIDEAIMYDWRSLEGAYAWGEVGYIQSLCDIMDTFPSSTAALTARLELYLIYSYVRQIHFCPQYSACTGHADLYTQEVLMLGDDMLSSYPNSWQAVYIEVYQLHQLFRNRKEWKTKTIALTQQQLKRYRGIDNAMPKAAIDFRKHIVDGITNNKDDLIPSFGARIYDHYDYYLHRNGNFTSDDNGNLVFTTSNLKAEKIKYYDDYFSRAYKDRKLRY